MMWQSLLVGALAGGCAGAIMTFLSHVAPRFGAGNFIRDLDNPHAFGKGISRREAHFIGLLIHLVLSVLYGAFFAFLVESGYAPGYHVIPMLVWATALGLFVGLVVMPLEGHGFFGHKHDAWFMVDALLTNFFWGALVLLLVRLWTAV